MAAITVKSQEEWLELRNQGIGGSDIPVLLGLSPYKTVLDLYREKTGQYTLNQGTSKYVKAGKYLEPAILKWTLDELKAEELQNYYFIDDNQPLMRGTPDALIKRDGTSSVLEIKSTLSATLQKQAPKTGTFPPQHYLCQLQFYLSLCKYETGYLSCLIDGSTLLIFKTMYDYSLRPIFEEAVSEFWRYVQKRVPPPKDFSEKYKVGPFKGLLVAQSS